MNITLGLIPGTSSYTVVKITIVHDGNQSLGPIPTGMGKKLKGFDNDPT